MLIDFMYVSYWTATTIFDTEVAGYDKVTG